MWFFIGSITGQTLCELARRMSAQGLLQGGLILSFVYEIPFSHGVTLPRRCLYGIMLALLGTLFISFSRDAKSYKKD